MSEPANLLAFGDDSGKRRKRQGTAIYAKGVIGGNESDIRLNVRPPMMAAGESAGFTELSNSTYGIPFTVGVGLRFYLLPRFSIGTGIDYSLLTRTFTGKYTKTVGSETLSETGSVYNTIHYLGIPLNLFYDIITTDRIKFYVYGGGEMDFCVSNKYTLYSSPNIVWTTPVKTPQFSVGAGLGVEFRLSKILGLYLDPGVKYYFNNGQPKSVRTDRPFMFNFDAGVRFNF